MSLVFVMGLCEVYPSLSGIEKEKKKQFIDNFMLEYQVVFSKYFSLGSELVFLTVLNAGFVLTVAF